MTKTKNISITNTNNAILCYAPKTLLIGEKSYFIFVEKNTV